MDVVKLKFSKEETSLESLELGCACHCLVAFLCTSRQITNFVVFDGFPNTFKNSQ